MGRRIAMVLIAYFFVDGIFSAIAAFQLRPAEGWGWLLASGVISVILAIMLWRQWPVSAVWLPGVLVGIKLIFSGMTMLMLGMAVGRVGKTIDEAVGGNA